MKVGPGPSLPLANDRVLWHQELPEIQADHSEEGRCIYSQRAIASHRGVKSAPLPSFNHQPACFVEGPYEFQSPGWQLCEGFPGEEDALTGSPEPFGAIGVEFSRSYRTS